MQSFDVPTRCLRVVSRTIIISRCERLQGRGKHPHNRSRVAAVAEGQIEEDKKIEDTKIDFAGLETSPGNPLLLLHCSLCSRDAQLTIKRSWNNSRRSLIPTVCLIDAGSAEPLGPSVADGGINFAVFSQHATAVTLELYNSDGSEAASYPLDRQSNRTGDIWHITIQGLPKSGVLYGYRVDGEGGWDQGHRWDASKVMLDPYAPLVAGRARFGVRDEFEQYREKVNIP